MLVDVIVRELRDLAAEDPMRVAYLHVLRALVMESQVRWPRAPRACARQGGGGGGSPFLKR